MKISSVSKKVLASALSAAMVVAFAPTVAFGVVAKPDGTASTGKVKVNLVDTSGNSYDVFFKDTVDGNGDVTETALQKAFDALAESDGIKVGTKEVTQAVTSGGTTTTELVSVDVVKKPTDVKSATVTLLDDVIGQVSYNGTTELTLELGDYTITNFESATAAKNALTTTKDNAAKGLIADAIAAAGGAFSGYDTKAKVHVTSYIVSGGFAKNIKFTYDTNPAVIDFTNSVDVSAQIDFDTLTVANDTVTITAGEGTVKAIDYKDADGKTIIDSNSIDGDVIIAAGTYEDIDGKATMKAGKVGKTTSVVVVKGATAEAGAVNGAVELKSGATLTVTASSAKDDAVVTGVKGITLGKDSKLTVNATASGDDSSVIAVDLAAAADFGTVDDSATLIVNATASGVDTNNDGNTTATGIKMADDQNLTFTNGTYTVKAVSDDAYGAAFAVKAAGTGKVTAEGKAAVELTSEAYKASNAFAVYGGLTAAGGTYTGRVGTLADPTDYSSTLTSGYADLTGGLYTQKPAKDQLADAAHESYIVEDADSTYWKVSQAKNFTVKNTDIAKARDIQLEDDSDEIEAFVEDALQQIAAGATTVKGMTFAEGVTAADVLKQARTTAGVTPVLTTAAYNAKKETAVSKAAKDAVDAYNKANLTKLSATYGETVYTVSLTLAYKKTGSSEWTTLATIENLGTKLDGRSQVERKVVLNKVMGTVGGVTQLQNLAHAASTVVAFDGTAASALAWDVKDNVTQNAISLNAIPAAIAVVTTDEEALKDAVINGQQPETPAVEKATQGIDVAKKSMTVKLGKKSKTSKSKTFSMGASAETKLTTSKKSGSKYITVKGQKVTLKKGVKKGTYTAKVSLKAASSAEYLAAAKTITVKFVVKK